MALYDKLASFNGRIVMLGCGSIGQGSLPLFLRHIDLKPTQITIIAADNRGHEIAEEYGIKFIIQALTPENYSQVLAPMLGKGDFLVNLSVDVDSVSLIQVCQQQGAMYIDTCIEPWAGVYDNPKLPYNERTNCFLRRRALNLREQYPAGSPTAVIAHGANPGLVSHFVKQALLNIAEDSEVEIETPITREGWAELSQSLGVKVIHIAERDTQVSETPKRPGEFVNTWSVDGFVGEGSQPAELGWGTHEKTMPRDARRQESAAEPSIYLLRPGAGTRVRSWTPLEGQYIGWLITHNESISLSDYLTVRANDKVIYRPTCHYAYHPCDDAVLSLHEFAGKGWEMQERKRLMIDEITSGMDELGVLLMGIERGAYWYGSRLSAEETRLLIPHNNATMLQVTVAVLSGFIWALENPTSGIVESEDMDFERILEIAHPYLGHMVGQYSSWTPLNDRCRLFPEEIDESDPWQFTNILVS